MGLRWWWMKKMKLVSQSENSVMAKKRRLNSPGSSSRRRHTKKQLLVSESEDSAITKNRLQNSSEASARIEQLPDDLLIHVLSFLPNLAEIAKTSILSRRWRYIWHNTTCLDFDTNTLMTKLLTKSKDRYTKWYIECINNVLDARVALPGLPLVKELRIGYHLEASMWHHIDRWIDFAIVNRVETLDLDFYDYFGNVPSRSHYKLTEEHWYRAPSGLSSLGCLKSLSLTHVNVDKQFVQFLLSSCPLLEDLSLCVAPNLYNLDISGSPPLRLRRLTIDNIRTFSGLCAPYLTSLNHQLPKSNPQKIDVPLLTDLTIDAGCVPYHQRIMEYLEQFWSYFPQLEKLVLIMQEVDKFKLKQVPHFNKLKYLKIRVQGDTNPICRQIINFMSACPMLETFALEIQFGYKIPRQRRRRNLEWHEVDNCLYKCLKVLELCWCDRKTIDQEVVGCIINKAPNLEKLIVCPWRREQKIKEFLKEKAKELCKGRPLEVEITVRDNSFE